MHSLKETFTMRVLNRFIALAALTALLLGMPTVGSTQNSPFPLQQTATIQAAAVATGNGSVFATGQMAAVALQVTGTYVGTVAFEGSNDNSTYVALTCFTLDSGTSVTGTSTTGLWRCNVTGLAAIRARISAYSSGSITVTANGTSNAMAVRDQIALSGAITGQLRGTQTTAPTCAVTNGAGTAIASSCVIDSATDSFIRGHATSASAGSGASSFASNLIVTFNAAYASAPACVASKDADYGYYVYAVTPTTTTATMKLSRALSVLTPASPTWVAQDTFSMICAGTQ
jgi:hypothetical protein